MPSDNAHQCEYVASGEFEPSLLFSWGPNLTSWISRPSEVDDSLYWLQAQGLSSSSKTSDFNEFISTPRGCNDLREYCHPPWPPSRWLSAYLHRTMIIGLGALTTCSRTSPTYGDQNISLGLPHSILTDSCHIVSPLSHLRRRQHMPFRSTLPIPRLRNPLACKST